MHEYTHPVHHYIYLVYREQWELRGDEIIEWSSA
jgi:hypothetical protein